MNFLQSRRHIRLTRTKIKLAGSFWYKSFNNKFHQSLSVVVETKPAYR
jgi:hypothetical protein